MSTVYKAVDRDSGHKVIVKAYHKKKMQPKHVHKLDREIAIMSSVSAHPCSTSLLGTFSDADNSYLVMEHCEGGDLFKAMLMAGGQLDEAWACVEVIEPLLAMLEELHARKVRLDCLAGNAAVPCLCNCWTPTTANLRISTAQQHQLGLCMSHMPIVASHTACR